MCSASKASAVSDDGQQPEVTSHAAEMGRRLGGTGGEHAVLEALKQEVRLFHPMRWHCTMSRELWRFPQLLGTA